MITPAKAMNSTVMALSTVRIRKNSVEASLNASLRAPLLEQLGEDGHEGRAQGGVGEQRAHDVGQLEGDREGAEGARGGEVARRDDLAHQPRDAREPGEDREDRRVARRRPPRRRGALRARQGPRPGRARSRSVRRTRGADATRRSRGFVSAAPGRATAGGAEAATLRRRLMANIHSQKKRILRAERERLENRRYTSTIRTFFRRLEAAVAAGDAETAADRAPHARADDRQGRQARRPASQHRRPQEVPRRAPAARRRRGLSAPAHRLT